ncbi:MAG: hypothetical protein AB9903_06980 [Vulcanimicrobiota bacterium]
MRRILGLSLAIIAIALFFSVITDSKFHLLYGEAEQKAISVYANPEPQSVQDDKEAFIRYLQMPGAEYAASRIGRSRPEEFLQILQKNLKVLQGLLGDENKVVSMNAAVSLHITGQDQSRMILKWLDSNVQWEKRVIIKILQRVNDRSKLAFAMGKIKAIAEDKSLDREFRDSARKILEH